MLSEAMCIWFAWQGFGSRGATGVASVSSCRKLPPCPTEPMPAGSKTDLLLAKAEPNSTSAITYLRRKTKQVSLSHIHNLTLTSTATRHQVSMLKPSIRCWVCVARFW